MRPAGLSIDSILVSYSGEHALTDAGDEVFMFSYIIVSEPFDIHEFLGIF